MSMEQVVEMLNTLNERMIRNLTEIGHDIETEEVNFREYGGGMKKKLRRKMKSMIEEGKAYHEGVEAVWKDFVSVLEDIRDMSDGEDTRECYVEEDEVEEGITLRFFGARPRSRSDYYIKFTVDIKEEEFYDADEWRRLIDWLKDVRYEDYWIQIYVSIGDNSNDVISLSKEGPGDDISYRVRLGRMDAYGGCKLNEVHVDHVWETFTVDGVVIDLEVYDNEN